MSSRGFSDGSSATGVPPGRRNAFIDFEQPRYAWDDRREPFAVWQSGGRAANHPDDVQPRSDRQAPTRNKHYDALAIVFAGWCNNAKCTSMGYAWQLRDVSRSVAQGGARDLPHPSPVLLEAWGGRGGQGIHAPVTPVIANLMAGHQAFQALADEAIRHDFSAEKLYVLTETRACVLACERNVNERAFRVFPFQTTFAAAMRSALIGVASYVLRVPQNVNDVLSYLVPEGCRITHEVNALAQAAHGVQERMDGGRLGREAADGAPRSRAAELHRNVLQAQLDSACAVETWIEHRPSTGCMDATVDQLRPSEQERREGEALGFF